MVSTPRFFRLRSSQPRNASSVNASGTSGVRAAPDLGGHGHAVVAVLAQCPADQPLAATVAVGVGGVEERDTGLESCRQHRERVVLPDIAPVGAELPATETDDRDLPSSSAELPGLHPGTLCRMPVPDPRASEPSSATRNISWREAGGIEHPQELSGSPSPGVVEHRVLRSPVMARMEPLAIEECQDPELRALLGHFVDTLGFVPNSLLTMQRVPGLAKAVVQMNKAVFDPSGRVDLGPQAAGRAHGERGVRMSVLQGSHHGECVPPWCRRAEDGGGVRLPDERAVLRRRAGRSGLRDVGCVRAERCHR